MNCYSDLRTAGKPISSTHQRILLNRLKPATKVGKLITDLAYLI